MFIGSQNRDKAGFKGALKVCICNDPFTSLRAATRLGKLCCILIICKTKTILNLLTSCPHSYDHPRMFIFSSDLAPGNIDSQDYAICFS